MCCDPTPTTPPTTTLADATAIPLVTDGAACSSLACPTGYSQKSGTHTCAATNCDIMVDLNTCCEFTTEATCDSMIGTFNQCTSYDATFIVDVSSSICQGEELNDDAECQNFEYIEHFIRNLANGSTKADMSASIVQFSTIATMKLNHGWITGPQTVSNAIESLVTWPGGSTNLGLALGMVLDMKEESAAQWPASQNYYIITDGNPTDNPCTMADEWNAATANDNVYIVAIEETNLQKLACLNAEFVHLSHFADLNCLDCSKYLAPCSSYYCQGNSERKAGTHYCAGNVCTLSDQDRCCVPLPEPRSERRRLEYLD